MDELFKSIQQELGVKEQLPPLDRWQPKDVGSIDIRIAKDGAWYYQGSKIERPRMCRLFSTVLVREGEQYFLKTPVQKLQIQVDYYPFVVTLLSVEGKGEQQVVKFLTNVGDEVIVDADHPLTMVKYEQEAHPVVLV